MTLRLATWTLLASALLCAAPSARSGAFGVAPIRLDLDRGARTGLINITSDDDRKLYFQVKLFEWTQNAAGEDAYAESADLVFFPQILTVDPKQKRALRVGTKGPPGAGEKAYRLFIEEMPDPNDTGGTGAQVAVRLRFGVPIFYSSGTVQAKVEALGSEGANGEARLSVRNDGDRQLRFEEVILAQGEKVLSRAAGWYVFPGVTRTFVVTVPREVCPLAGRVEIRAVGEGREVRSTLDAGGLCPA